MAEAPSTITVLNQSKQVFQLSAAKGNAQFLRPGQAVELPAEHAQRLLGYRGLIDASKLVTNKSAAKKILDLQAENADLKAKLDAANAVAAGPVEPEADDAEAKDGAGEDIVKGSAVLLPDGGLGDVVKINTKKGEASVKLRVNGNVSPFALKDLKLAPKE